MPFIDDRVHGPEESADFEKPSADGKGPPDARWRITMAADGSLAIYATGNKSGRVMIQPASDTSFSVTTTRILRLSNAEQKESLQILEKIAPETLTKLRES